MTDTLIKTTNETFSETLVITKLVDLEKNEMIKALTACQGNISQASKALGIGRATFYRKAKKYNLKGNE